MHVCTYNIRTYKTNIENKETQKESKTHNNNNNNNVNQKKKKKKKEHLCEQPSS
jgi:hypothetical protein